jgi:hypothetical protein
MTSGEGVVAVDVMVARALEPANWSLDVAAFIRAVP